MKSPADIRIGVVCVSILLLDQLTKLYVIRRMDFGHELVVLEGFFKFVLWGNTGAAWSLFHGKNDLLAWVSVAAMIVLFAIRRHFEVHRWAGQLAMGLMFGGILGNLIDRVRFGQVIDFIRFYIQQRGGDEIGFPAFNVADTAICTGVGILLLLSWNNEDDAKAAPAASAAGGAAGEREAASGSGGRPETPL